MWGLIYNFNLFQIAAKINPGGASGDTAGQKRPLEDGSGMDWTGNLILAKSPCFLRYSFIGSEFNT